MLNNNCDGLNRHNLQSRDAIMTDNGYVHFLEIFGLHAKNKSPEVKKLFTDHELRDEESLFNDFLSVNLYLNTTKTPRHTPTLEDGGIQEEKKFRNGTDFSMYVDRSKENIQEALNLQPEDKASAERLRISMEGTIRTRNRKCPKPKRLASQYVEWRERRTPPTRSQSSDYRTTASNSLNFPSGQKNTYFDNQLDCKISSSECFGQPVFPRKAQIKYLDFKDGVFDTYDTMGKTNTETQSSVLLPIKKEAEEKEEQAREIHFTTSKDIGRHIVNSNINKAEFCNDSLRLITSMNAHKKRTECKIEYQSMEDHKNVLNYQWHKPYQYGTKIKAEKTDNGENNNPQSSSSVKKKQKRSEKYRAEDLLLTKLSPTYYKDCGPDDDIKIRLVKDEGGTCKDEGPTTAHIKQENFQEYELEHWCDLGPSASYDGGDSFDGKDEKEDIDKPFTNYNGTYHNKNEIGGLCTTVPNGVQFSHQPAKIKVPFESPNSAFHRPIKQALPNAGLRSVESASTPDSYIYGVKGTHYMYPFCDTTYLHSQPNHHLPRTQCSIQPTVISTMSLAALSQSQPASISFPHSLYMNAHSSRQAFPHGVYQCPYVPMISNQSSWNPLQSLSSASHQSYGSSLLHEEYVKAKSNTISPLRIPFTGFATTKNDGSLSARSSRGQNIFQSFDGKEDHMKETNFTRVSISCPKRKENFSPRSSKKPRLRKRNEDFLDPTAMKFDGDEDSDEGQQMQLASDDEWKPDQAQGDDDQNSDTDLDDNDDHEGRAQSTRSRSSHFSNRNRMDPQNTLRNTEKLIQALKEPQGKLNKCPTCGKLCKGNYQLRRHQMSHSEFRPFQCSQCDKGFKQKSHLKGHSISVHGKPEQLKPKKIQRSIRKNIGNCHNKTSKLDRAELKGTPKCSTNKYKETKSLSCKSTNREAKEINTMENMVQCEKASSPGVRPRIGRPKTAQKDGDFCCSICGKGFKTAYRLKRHELSHTDVRPYACRTCGKRFKQSGHRNEHETNHQRQGIRFLCNKCGMVFRCRSSFNSHMRAHSQAQTDQGFENGLRKMNSDGSYESSKTLEEWKVVNTAYDCPYCVEKFATAQALNNHLDSHVEVQHRRHVQPYSCDICRRSFTYRHNLLKHSLRHKAPEKFADFLKEKLEAHVASGKPSYKCSHCSKVFMRKETLAKHTKIHTGLKPFKCSICSQTFTQNIHLKVHMRKHTGSRPFQCRECGKGFIDSTALAKHIEYEACNSENYVYHCKLCDKRHYYLGSIKQHIRKDHNIHDDDLDAHMEKTERVVKVKIGDCSKAKSDNHTKQQEFSGHGEHKCLICSLKFKEKAYLLRHVKRKHTQLRELLNKDQHKENLDTNASTAIETSDVTQICKNQCDETNKFALRNSSSISINTQVESFSDPRPLVIDLTNILSQVGSKPVHVTSDLNPEMQQKDAPSDSQTTFDTPKFSKPTRNPTHAEKNASNSIESTDVDSETSTMCPDSKNVLGKSKEIPFEDDRQNLEKDDDNVMETIEESSSPSENFLYKIGLTVSRKGKRSMKCSPQNPVIGTVIDTSEKEYEKDVSVKPGPNIISLINKSKGSSFEFGAEETDGKEQSTIPENISVLDLDAKQLYCKDGFTGDSFVVDLNKLDVSESASSKEASARGGHVITSSLLTGELQSSIDSVKKSQCKNSKESSQACDSTQSPKGRRPYNRKACVPVPLDLSQSHLRGQESTATTSLASPNKTNKCNNIALARHGCRARGRDASLFVQNSSVNISEKQPDSAVGTTMHQDLDRSLPNMPKKPAKNSRKASATTGKYYIHVPDSVPVKITPENVITYISSSFAPKPPTSFRSKDVDALSSVVRDREMNERPMDLSSNTKSPGFPSYESTKSSTTQSSYSTPEFPTVLGLFGTSLDPPATSHWNEKGTIDYETQKTDRRSRNLDNYMTLPNIHLVGDRLSQANRNSNIGYTTNSHCLGYSDPWNHQSNPTNSTGDIDLGNRFPSSPSSQQQHRFDTSPATTRSTTTSAITTTRSAATVTQSAQNSPPSLPDSTVKTDSGFSCEKCGKTFNARHRLKRHELTHTDFRPYSCPQCGRAFRQKIHLSDHIKRHAGHRPFSCGGCGKRFILKNEMNQHVKHYCCGGSTARRDGSREATPRTLLDSPTSSTGLAEQTDNP